MCFEAIAVLSHSLPECCKSSMYTRPFLSFFWPFILFHRNEIGVSGKMTTEGADEDDNFGTESSQRAILAVLGPERRNRVLAGLYMGRSDTALLVRQAALHVWKVIVTHTPRMLREILPTLFSLLLGCLANQSNDKQQVLSCVFIHCSLCMP